MLYLLWIVEGYGTSFEPDQPAHPCCLTRIYTVGCSDSYFDIDIPKIYNGLFRKLNLDISQSFNVNMVRVKKECYFCPAKENFTLSKYKPGDLFFSQFLY